MKPLIRIGALFLLVALLVISSAPGFALTARAADDCFGLKADDCALAQAAALPETMAKLSSFSMDYELTLKVAGGPQDGNVDVNIKGSGPFQFTGESMAQLAQGNPNAILSKITMSNTIALTTTANGKTTTTNLEIRVLNGTLYFQGDKATNGQWKSIDLKTAMNRRGFRNVTRGAVNPVQALQMVAAFRKLAAIPGFIKAERGVDATIENQQIAVFTYHIDLPTLFNSPDFVAFLKSLPTNGGLKNMTDDQIKQMSAMGSAMFKDSNISLTRLVGTTDKLPHGVGFDVSAKLNPMAMMMMSGGGSPSGSTATPVDVNFHFLVKLSGIGAKANVTAPAGATPVDLGPVEAAPTSEATAAATMAATP